MAANVHTKKYINICIHVYVYVNILVSVREYPMLKAAEIYICNIYILNIFITSIHRSSYIDMKIFRLEYLHICSEYPHIYSYLYMKIFKAAHSMLPVHQGSLLTEEIRHKIVGSPDPPNFRVNLFSDGDSVYSFKNLSETLGTPVKTCLICKGTPVKTCWKFWQM